MREITIGRGQDNDITINDSSVSRHHATIIQSSSGIVVNDNGSSNGTFINGNRIQGECALSNNDILKLGSALIPWMNYVGIKEESHSLQTKLIKEEVSKPNPSPAPVVESSNVQNQNVQQHVIVQQIGSPSNGLGTAGFVLGLVGLIIFPTGIVFGPLGFIFSFVGLFKIPRGLAIAGLILSPLGFIISLLFWARVQ
jgi:pSer/pThr/pTyr-binding forkhead associated (FHA) protein